MITIRLFVSAIVGSVSDVVSLLLSLRHILMTHLTGIDETMQHDVLYIASFNINLLKSEECMSKNRRDAKKNKLAAPTVRKEIVN